MAESEEELKSLLMRVKEESEKASLKLNIQKKKIMASNPITSWQIDGEEVETVTDFIFLGSKITVPGDCSHEIKRCSLLGRKAMTNLDSRLKSKDVTLLTKICIVKVRVFPVFMYGCESWTLKKAEHWRIDAFELWCWRRLLRVLLTARRPNQSNLKEINWIFIGKTDADAEAPVLWPPDAKNHLLEKTLFLRKIEGMRKREQQRIKWLDCITNSMDKFEQTLGDSEWQDSLVLQSMGSQRVRHSSVTEQQ